MKSFTPFLDMKLGKTKILVLWNALNDEKSHNNSQQCLLYYKTWWCVCVVEILLEVVKKNWLWGIFHIAKCPNFYELIYDFSGQKISKNGTSRQSSNYKDSYLWQVISQCIKTGRVLHYYIFKVFGFFFVLKISQVLTLKISLQ